METLRVINLIGPRLTALLGQRFGPRVEIVDAAPDGEIGDDLHGDALIAPGRAAGKPAESWLLQVADRGVGWVHIAGAGVGDLSDRIFESGRLVTCSRGAMATPISEFALASMLAFEKRFPSSWLSEPPPEGWGFVGAFDPDEAPDAPRFETPPRWGYADLGSLSGRVLGIFGFGSIGQATARKALAFDMRVVAVRRKRAPSPVDGVGMLDDLDELAVTSDHLLCCAPGTPATARIFDDRLFAKMKPSAHFLNLSRGTLVDHEALIRGLDAGRPAFASLDVTDPEPLEAGHPLYGHPRVHLSPHISWCSPREQQRTAEIIVENVSSYLEGRQLHGRVDPNDRY